MSPGVNLIISEPETLTLSSEPEPGLDPSLQPRRWQSRLFKCLRFSRVSKSENETEMETKSGVSFRFIFSSLVLPSKEKKEALVVKSILRNQRTNAAWLRFIPDATSVNLAALCASVVEISQVEGTRTLRNSRSCHLHCNPYRHRYLKFDFRLKTNKNSR